MDQRRSRLIELVVRPDVSDDRVEAALKALAGDGQRNDAMEDRFFSVKEAMKFLGVSRVFLWQRRKKHGLKDYKMGGRIVFRKQDLQSHVLNSGSNGCTEKGGTEL